jgi:hypothetical protein
MNCSRKSIIFDERKNFEMGFVSRIISSGQKGVGPSDRGGHFYTDETILAKIYLRLDKLLLEGFYDTEGQRELWYKTLPRN